MKRLLLKNAQRAHSLRLSSLREAARTLLENLLELPSYELAIHFIGSSRMAQMNKQFLDHEGSTDVITFDYREGYGEPAKTDLNGEIFISVPDAIAQSRIYKRPWEEELIRYMVHGVLHLRGFDDLEPAKRKKMKAAEERLLKKLARKVP